MGPTPLAVRELLELILSGHCPRARVQRFVDALATAFPSPSALAEAPFEDLAAVVGPRCAARLVAAVELGRRTQVRPMKARPVIHTAVDVFQLLGTEMSRFDREHFRSILLNTKNQVIRVSTVSIGGLSQAPVHPREVFKEAIKHSACTIIVVHNHPSGDATPSAEDHTITDHLAAAGKLIGIPVLDHIIIGEDQYVSLREQGFLASYP